MKLKFTKSSIDRQCLPPADGEVNGAGRVVRQKAHWDTDRESPRGFGLVVSRTCSTFVIQRQVGGRTVRTKVGRYGDMTLEQARARAREIAQEMAQGVDPNRRPKDPDSEWKTYTLRQARDEHLANMAADNCTERSKAQLRDEVGRHLRDWLDRPLAEIRRADCIDRHRELTAERGPVAANRAMCIFRACWNSAARRYEDLPPHPVRGVKFNRLRRRRQPIPWADLPAWAAKVNALPNPIRRDWRWFVLLTGLRSEDARTVRWEHIDFKAGTLHRPKPKGGEDRAFTVPLSQQVLELLKRRREDNERDLPGDDRGWVWPTRNRDGHVTHMRESKELEYYRDEHDKLHRRVAVPSPHRQRDTYATAGHEAGVHPLDLKILMNHTLPEGDVTEGYIRPSLEHLRECQERITVFLLDKAGVTVTAGRIGPQAASA